MKINQLKAGIILSYSSMGVGYAISIIYTPIMLRLLGQSEYGLYNFVSSIVAYLGLLNFGFGSAYVRYYSRYKVADDKQNIAKLNGMFLIIFSVIGLIALLAGMILALNTEAILGKQLSSIELHRAKILMLIMVINIAISFPGVIFNSHITANEQFIFQKFLQMIKVVVNPLLVLPVLLLGYGSVGMVVVTTILNLSIEIANVVFCFKKLDMQFSFRHFDFSLMREMTLFSSFIFINMITDQINWNVDKFILGRFYGTIIVAIYGLAAQINSYYLSLSTAISNVFIPRVNKMVAMNCDNKELTQLFTKIGRVQFILLAFILIGFVCFGRPFINMWAGRNYDDSYPIALLLILPVTIPLIQNIGIEIQRAKNMHQFRSWLYLFIALGNLVISIPLARAYGGIGAALGTSISLIIGNGFIMNWYYHVKIKLDIKYFWYQIVKFLPPLIPPFAVGIMFNIFIDLYKIHLFLLAAAVYAIIFLISMWVFGMNQYERELIANPTIRLMRRLKLAVWHKPEP